MLKISISLLLKGFEIVNGAVFAIYFSILGSVHECFPKCFGHKLAGIHGTDFFDFFKNKLLFFGTSGDSSQEKLGAEKNGGLGAKPGRFQRPRPLDLRETLFFIMEIGPF